MHGVCISITSGETNRSYLVILFHSKAPDERPLWQETTHFQDLLYFSETLPFMFECKWTHEQGRYNFINPWKEIQWSAYDKYLKQVNKEVNTYTVSLIVVAVLITLMLSHPLLKLLLFNYQAKVVLREWFHFTLHLRYM